MSVNLIFCQSLNAVIGKDNDLLYNIPEDMKRFKDLTQNSTVIMGRNTWLSIPEKFRPLPNRLNIVLSRDHDLKYPGVQVIPSLKQAIDIFKPHDNIWIIGGESVFEEGMKYADHIYQTLVYDFKDGDIRAPQIFSDEWSLDSMSIIHNKGGVKYQFRNYSRKNHDLEKAPVQKTCTNKDCIQVQGTHCEGSSCQDYRGSYGEESRHQVHFQAVPQAR